MNIRSNSLFSDDYEKITIRQANSDDIPIIETIFLDVIEWMNKTGIHNLWNSSNTAWEALSKQYSIDQFYIVYIDEIPVGCMALTEEDTDYWPDVPKGNSLFLHKLAVVRKFAGLKISKHLITFAKKMAKNRGCNTLRLDCNGNQTKLIKLYEAEEFQFVKELMKNDNYKIALYEYILS